MLDEKTVDIQPLDLIGEDSRGASFSFALPRGQSEFLMIERKKGSLSGNTYHEGKVSGTSPKIFILLKGQLQFNYRYNSDAQSYTSIVDSPAMITVLPGTVHNVVAMTDIKILECNSLDDIRKDVVRMKV